MKRIQKGFTLIELMIVVAIVGILAAIALPSYQDFTIRARVSEAAAAAGACKTGVAEFTAATGALPSSTTQAGCSGSAAATQFVATTNVGASGVITVTMTTNSKLAAAAGGTLTLTPTLGTSGNVISTWHCTGSPQKYMPGSCR